MSGHALPSVIAAVTILSVVATAAIVAVCAAFGGWLAKRLTRRPGEPGVRLRDALRRRRAELREQLTPGERRFFYGYGLVSPLLAPVGIGLLVFGSHDTRGVGIGLLLVALLVMAVPISPFLRARIRRREGRSHRE
jgi:hypothetical protein